MPAHPKFSHEDVAMALGACRGNISAAARRLGCTREALYARLNNSPELKAALDQVREEKLDDLEDELYKQAMKGNTTALIFSLKTQGYRRGYQEVRKVQMDADVRTTDEAKKQDEKWEQWNETLAAWAAAEKDDEDEDE